MADELGPQGPTGGAKKTSKGMIMIIGIIAFVLIGVFAIMMMGGGDSTPVPSGTSPHNPAIPITLPQLETKVTELKTSLDSLNGRVANIDTRITTIASPNVTEADITSLQASINTISNSLATLQGAVAGWNVSNSTPYNATALEDLITALNETIADITEDFDERLDELEGNGGDDGDDEEDELPTSTKWDCSLSISSDYEDSEAQAYILSPGSLDIEEGGSYLIEVEVLNGNENETVNLTLTLVAETPVPVDRNTFFYGATIPWDWETTKVENSGKCHRIIGKSKDFLIIEDGEEIEVRFQLVYED